MPLIGLGAAQGPPLKASIAAFLAHGGKLIDTAIMHLEPHANCLDDPGPFVKI